MKKAEEIVRIVTCPKCSRDNEEQPPGSGLPMFCMFCGENMHDAWLKAHTTRVAVCSEEPRHFKWDPKVKRESIPEGLKYCPVCGGKLTFVERPPVLDPWEIDKTTTEK